MGANVPLLSGAAGVTGREALACCDQPWPPWPADARRAPSAAGLGLALV